MLTGTNAECLPSTLREAPRAGDCVGRRLDPRRCALPCATGSAEPLGRHRGARALRGQVTLPEARGRDSGSRRVKRVIPCLDVKEGRVVKGVTSSTCAMRAIRSSCGALRPGEPTSWCSSTSRRPRGAAHDWSRRRTAEEVFIPFTIGGGLRRPTTSARCWRRERTRSRSTRRRCATRRLSNAVADLRLAVHRGRDRRQARKSAAVGGLLNGGRSTPASTRSSGPSGSPTWGRENLLTSMDRDGTKVGFDTDRLPRSRARSTSRSSPRAERERSSTSPRLSLGDMRMQCLQPRCSMTACTPSHRSRKAMADAGVSVRISAVAGSSRRRTSTRRPVSSIRSSFDSPQFVQRAAERPGRRGGARQGRDAQPDPVGERSGCGLPDAPPHHLRYRGDGVCIRETSDRGWRLQAAPTACPSSCSPAPQRQPPQDRAHARPRGRNVRTGGLAATTRQRSLRGRSRSKVARGLSRTAGTSSPRSVRARSGVRPC